MSAIRRLGALAALAALTPVAWAPTSSDAAGSDAGGVSVTVIGGAGSGSTAFLSLGRLRRAASSVTDYAYRRTSGGAFDSAYPHSGATAAELAELAGVPAAAVDELTVSRPSGPPIELSRREVVHGFDGYPDRGSPHPATFGEGYDGGAIRFFRPARSETDPNGDDEVNVGGGETLRVTIATSTTVYQVDADGPDGQLTAGQSAQFDARAPGLPDGVTATWRWEFDDGATAATAAPTHPYTADGSYLATVTLTASDGGVGVAQVPVQVGDPARSGGDPPPGQPSPPAPPSPQAGGDPAGGGGPTGGVAPATTGGGRGRLEGPASGPRDNRDAAAGGSPRGRTTGPAATAPQDRRGGERATRTGDGGPERAASEPQPSTAPPASPPATTVPQPGPLIGTDDAGGAEIRAPGERAGARTRRRGGDSGNGGRLEHVSGILLASAGVSARELAAATAPHTGDPRRQEMARSSGGGAPPTRWWLLGVLAVACLVGLGVAREAGVVSVRRMRLR
ncbi:PKD domain-containing protein [Conexibacter sp. CPCC 206217]|uniref:PKD domain-containing protein n=1 Tax=Conexibacter sp. CPCC 206217 TaxID=3064574 RepID=UPI00272099A1|nr:PKD domain-containing protein [Conexibacter sp. CPCC 206217]MDO8211687.1 PKD domain-containing protein [Conexibacter sp. CPCC 206217]